MPETSVVPDSGVKVIRDADTGMTAWKVPVTPDGAVYFLVASSITWRPTHVTVNLYPDFNAMSEPLNIALQDESAAHALCAQHAELMAKLAVR